MNIGNAVGDDNHCQVAAISKRSWANMRYAARKHNLSKAAAVGKRIGSDAGDTIWYVNLDEFAAVRKCHIFNVRDMGRKDNTPQIAAAVKSSRSDTGDTVRNRNAFKHCTINKSAFPDSRHMVGDGNTDKLMALKERILPDGTYTIGDYNMAVRSHVSNQYAVFNHKVAETFVFSWKFLCSFSPLSSGAYYCSHDPWALSNAFSSGSAKRINFPPRGMEHSHAWDTLPRPSRSSTST